MPLGIIFNLEIPLEGAIIAPSNGISGFKVNAD
jgi:hypothetical protein